MIVLTPWISSFVTNLWEWKVVAIIIAVRWSLWLHWCRRGGWRCQPIAMTRRPIQSHNSCQMRNQAFELIDGVKGFHYSPHLLIADKYFRAAVWHQPSMLGWLLSYWPDRPKGKAAIPPQTTGLWTSDLHGSRQGQLSSHGHWTRHHWSGVRDTSQQSYGQYWQKTRNVCIYIRSIRIRV